MKELATSSDLSKSLQSATLWPLIFVAFAIAVTFSAVLFRQHQQRSQELRALFHRNVEAQKQFFTQELLLARAEAINLRLELLVSDWQNNYPGSMPCIEIHQFGAGQSLPKFARCALESRAVSDGLRDELSLSAGDIPLGSILFWQQSPLSLTLSGFRILSAVFVLLFLLAIVAHLILLRRVEKGVLWPLVDRLVEERRKAEVVDAVRMVAHDIRRPFQLLQSAMRAIPLEQLGDAKPLMERVLVDVESNADGVSAMLEDVLDTHREVSLNRSDVFLLPYLQAIAREADLARVESGKPTITVSDATGRTLSLDERKFRRVLANLLENAIQFAGASGRISVTSSQRIDKDGNWIEITVWNDGPAIAPEDMTRLFVRSFSRRAGGTGLGLISARRIVEAHGGRIHCESFSGEGTTFVITLPANNAVAAVGETATRVVAFDDDASVRSLFDFQQASAPHVTIHVFRSWEHFVESDAYELLAGAICVIDMNYEGSQYRGDDIARHAARLGAKRLIAFTSNPESARAAGVFDEVVQKGRFDIVRRFVS